MTVQQLFDYAVEHDMLDYEIAVSCVGLEAPECSDYVEFQGLTEVIDSTHTKYYEYGGSNPKDSIWLVCGDGDLYEDLT
jgi:hypothetical protein